MISLYLVEKAIILFFLYAFIGWAIETGNELIFSRKFVNRGFLMGPICPVYGLGAVLITGVLYNYSKDYFVVFCLSALMCGCLEYFTSYLMEKLFHARWWDYSNFKYNVNGRICLDTTVLFGLAGVGIFMLTNPLFDYLIFNNLSNEALTILCIVLGSILLVDVIISFIIVSKIKDISKETMANTKDSTEDISKKVREIIMEKSLPYRRVIEAFPQVFAGKVKEGARLVASTAAKAKDKTIENINNAKNKTVENLNIAKERTINSFNNLKKKTQKTIKFAKIKTIKGIKLKTIKIKSNKEKK